MPKSKRIKRTALTNVVSKGRELKTELVDSIRQAIDAYEHLYVVSFENMRSNLFKSVRAKMTDSRIFLGKNKVMALALGKTEAEEYSTKLCKVGRILSGNRCLLFSNDGPDVISALFDSFQVEDFARSGTLDFVLCPMSYVWCFLLWCGIISKNKESFQGKEKEKKS